MILGLYGGTQSCELSKRSNNGSVLITGRSGSGKTCKLNALELSIVKEGGTVLAIDCSRTHRYKALLPDIRDEYIRYLHYIDAREGLELNLFKPLCDGNRQEEDFNIIASNVAAFSHGNSIGVRQQIALRNTITEAICLQQMVPEMGDADALIKSFENHPKDGKRQAVYQKLWTLLHADILRRNTGETTMIHPGKINIIDLSKIEITSAVALAEILLAYVWRVTFFSGLKRFGGVTLILDEFQNLSLKKDSALRTILREGRRFGLSVILATQSIAGYDSATTAMLSQAATHLIFRPADTELKKTAQLIDSESTASWVKVLRELRTGECIAVGEKSIKGTNFSRPLKLI